MSQPNTSNPTLSFKMQVTNFTGVELDILATSIPACKRSSAKKITTGDVNNNVVVSFETDPSYDQQSIIVEWIAPTQRFENRPYITLKVDVKNGLMTSWSLKGTPRFDQLYTLLSSLQPPASQGAPYQLVVELNTKQQS